MTSYPYQQPQTVRERQVHQLLALSVSSQIRIWCRTATSGRHSRCLICLDQICGLRGLQVRLGWCEGLSGAWPYRVVTPVPFASLFGFRCCHLMLMYTARCLGWKRGLSIGGEVRVCSPVFTKVCIHMFADCKRVYQNCPTRFSVPRMPPPASRPRC